MPAEEWQKRLMDEIRKIPEPRLAEVYEFIHFFRLGVQAGEPVETGKPGLSQADMVNTFRGSGGGGGAARLISDRKADLSRET